MKALIIGATGATGKDLVGTLLQDPDYTAVTTFVRRPTGITHAKLKEIVTDFGNLSEVSTAITGDVVFSCLGTTLQAAGSKQKQWQIDYEIPTAFARIAKQNYVPAFVLLSAYSASTKSRVFYSRMKGELEEQIGRIGFEKYILFRPGLLLRKNTDRLGERISAKVLKFLNSMGLIRNFKPLSTSFLAEKLAKAPKTLPAGKHIISLAEIFDF